MSTTSKLADDLFSFFVSVNTLVGIARTQSDPVLFIGLQREATDRMIEEMDIQTLTEQEAVAELKTELLNRADALYGRAMRMILEPDHKESSIFINPRSNGQ